MSSTILNTLDGQRFDGIMQFMYELRAAGFNDEFDNSLVMRMIWNKLSELKTAVGMDDSKSYFTAKAEPNPLHGTVLILKLHSTIKEDTDVYMVLFVRNDRIFVSSNVLTEEVKPNAAIAEVPASGMYWFEAEKLFKASPRFDKKVAGKAFRAAYKALAPRGDDMAVRLVITPMPMGWRVEYRKYGKKLLVMFYEFDKQ